MQAKRCTLCLKIKSLEDFEERDDDMTVGYFAWCKTCMKEQGRSVDYPAKEERGGGVYKPNYSSLRRVTVG